MPDTVTIDTVLRFFGRLHPMLVHFPIALLVTTAVVEFLRSLFRGGISRAPKSAMGPACIGFGAIFACLAAWFGWLNADFEGQNVDKVFWHRWLGVAVAVIALVTWVVSMMDRAEEGGTRRVVYRLLLWVATGLITIGGHLGAELTYGEGYLLAAFDEPQDIPEPGAIEIDPNVELVDYAKTIEPIFAEHCYECHGVRKGKGGLRLHDMSLVFEGAADTWVIRPGDPDASELIARITLPAAHEDVMPAKGDVLDADTIASIATWIEQGAAWVPVTRPEPESEPETETVSEPGAEPVAPPVAPPDAFVDRALIDEAAVARAVVALEEIGAIAIPLAQDTLGYDVNLARARETVDDAALGRLAGLESSIVWLDLSGTAITDDALAVIAQCTQLRRLRIDSTQIGDAGLGQLASLTKLESLNLRGTKVTDAGLQDLGALPALSRLYLWQTAVTGEAVDAFRAAHPGIEVDDGRDAVARLAPPPEPELSGAVSFVQDIRPIFETRCYGCHGPDKQKAGLRLDVREEVLDNVVIAGKPDESEMFIRVSLPAGDEDIMPPKDGPLTAAQIAALRTWIEAGAEWPD